MNLIEIITSARELYKKLTDPNLSQLAKALAFIDFAIMIRKLIADAGLGELSASESPATAEAALADLEALGLDVDGEGLAKIGDGVLAKKLLELLIKFAPLILTIL